MSNTETQTPINFTLTKEHIKTVCKPGKGKKTCAYLSGGSNGLKCAKFSPLMNIIGDRLRKKEMRAQGDNCDALLGEILKQKAELIGKKAMNIEKMPTIEEEGVVEDLIYNKGKNWFSIMFKPTKSSAYAIGFSTKSLEITNSPDSITFELAGMGAFAGQLKISL